MILLKRHCSRLRGEANFIMMKSKGYFTSEKMSHSTTTIDGANIKDNPDLLYYIFEPRYYFLGLKQGFQAIDSIEVTLYILSPVTYSPLL